MLDGLGTQIEKDGLLDKYRRPESNAVCTEEWSYLTKKFLEALPYTLTSSQLHAVSDIIWDLKRPVPMNRLLQVLILLSLLLLYYHICTLLDPLVIVFFVIFCLLMDFKFLSSFQPGTKLI